MVMTTYSVDRMQHKKLMIVQKKGKVVNSEDQLLAAAVSHESVAYTGATVVCGRLTRCLTWC